MIAGRVIMLSRDQGLASIAGQLRGRGQPLTRFSSPSDVPDWLRPPTGAVVLDYPKPSRVIVYRQLRQRYLGPVLALLDPEETSSGLPVDQGRIGILHRPFTGEELSASLDKLVGSRTIARRTKSRALTAPPLGAEAGLASHAELASTAAFALAPPPTLPPRSEPSSADGSLALAPRPNGHTAAARRRVPLRLPSAARFPATEGIPAARVSQRPVAATTHRLSRRHRSSTARRRLNSLALVLAATSALVLGATLSDGRGCQRTSCGNLAGATQIRSGALPPADLPPAATPRLGTPSGGSGQPPGPRPPSDASPAPQPAPRMIIGLATSVDDLLRGTSSSSGGAPLLIVTPRPTPPSPPSSGSGGGTPAPSTTTTPPTTTSAPSTTAPPTTAPPTTAPPTTAPPTTAPPTTEPPTTEPPTTEPPTTAPPTTEPTTTEAPTTAPPATAADTISAS